MPATLPAWPTQWQHVPVTILGMSKSGIAVAEYLTNRGARCLISETGPATPTNKATRESLQSQGIELEMGGHTDRCFSHSDWVITSPGIPPSAAIMKELLLSGKTIISEVELAWREAPQIPIVAITGTNGKTTTTTLTSAIFTHAHKKAPAGGNIGIPLISLLDQQPDYLIAELSSYQLAFSPDLNPKVAVYTNFRPDHLDWHGSIDAYQQAKASLFLPPKAPQWSVLNAADPVCESLGKALTTPVFWFSLSRERVETQPNWIALDDNGMIWVKRQTHSMGQPEALFSIHESPLLGAHNQENILAAMASAIVCDIPIDAIRFAVSQFQGVEHRMELLPEVDGIRFYNDSKATNPDATICALNAFIDNPVVLIAGGRDKKTSLTEWIDSVKAHAHCVVLLGEAADRFETELKANGYNRIIRSTSFEDAVAKAYAEASSGHPVLFSPACASFDMFKNFEERGSVFKQTVAHLKEHTAQPSR